MQTPVLVQKAKKKKLKEKPERNPKGSIVWWQRKKWRNCKMLPNGRACFTQEPGIENW
jgi:hypothetical protein